jgi:dihydroflavonol-4-reductase
VTTLVTGATGFVGSAVARALVNRGTPVRVLVRRGSSLRLLEQLAVETVTGDLNDPPSCRAALEGCDALFHVAADYRLWARDPSEIYDSNVGGTRNLMSAIGPEVERVIYTSTVATVAVPRDRLPDETTDASIDEMIGHYKRSKFEAERIAVDAARRGLPIVIVNPTTPVGPGDWRPTPTGAVIVDFLRRRLPAYVQTGLNIVPVEDVARGHLLAAERGRFRERYILGGVNLTFKELLDALARVSGLRAPRVRLPWHAALALGHIDRLIASLQHHEPRIPLEGVRMARHRMWVSSAKAERELGFRPGSVDEALERAVRWYREHGYVTGFAAKSPRVRGAEA